MWAFFLNTSFPKIKMLTISGASICTKDPEWASEVQRRQRQKGQEVKAKEEWVTGGRSLGGIWVGELRNFSLCFVIKRCFNEKETQAAANATAINKSEKSLLQQEQRTVMTFPSLTSCLLASFSVPLFLLLFAFVYCSGSQNTLVALLAETPPLAFTFPGIISYLQVGQIPYRR